jgi:hypothetical protein
MGVWGRPSPAQVYPGARSSWTCRHGTAERWRMITGYERERGRSIGRVVAATARTLLICTLAFAMVGLLAPASASGYPSWNRYATGNGFDIVCEGGGKGNSPHNPLGTGFGGACIISQNNEPTVYVQDDLLGPVDFTAECSNGGSPTSGYGSAPNPCRNIGGTVKVYVDLVATTGCIWLTTCGKDPADDLPPLLIDPRQT